MGLTVKDDDPAARSGVGFVGASLALLAAGFGAVRWWRDLDIRWSWVGLALGAFAVGLLLVRMAVTDLRDPFALVRGVGVLTMAGAAIAGVVYPLAPPIAIAVWASGWILPILFFQE